MNAWAVLATIAVVSLLYVVIPVGLATRRHFRTHKLVRCPVLGIGAGVLMRRTGLAEVVGWPAIRRVVDCTYWPHIRRVRRAAGSLRTRRFATTTTRSREVVPSLWREHGARLPSPAQWPCRW
jgi:hypothetical protein